MSNLEPNRDEVANGAALAAFLAAGIGALAVGVVVVLNEAELFLAPALYGPAGGVSGRTTIAAAIWLLAWIILHRRWNGLAINAGRVFGAAMVLIGLGVLLTFPPIWQLV